MALPRTYGPVAMTLDPDDSTIAGTPAFSGEDAYWYDDHGWLVYSTVITGAGLSPVWVINLDGVVILRKNTPTAFGYGDFMYDYLTNKGMTIVSSQLALLEPETGTYSFAIRNTTTVRQIRTPEGWYRLSGSNIQRGDLDMADDTGYVTEYTIVSNPGTFGASSCVSPGPGNTIYFCYNQGHIVQYDYIKKEEVYPNPNQVPVGSTGRLNLGVAVERFVYSQRLDCFMAIDTGSPSSVSVWAAHPEDCVPNAISAPVASPTVEAGVVSEISVTLTDDFGVGIPGRLIDWSITAGNGDLLDAQTTTDADGIATTQYRAPISGGVNPTIQASLTY